MRTLPRRHQRPLKQFDLHRRRAGQGKHCFAGYPSLLLPVANHHVIPSRKIVFDDDACFHQLPVAPAPLPLGA